MVIKVLGIGNHSTLFDSTKEGFIGVINRAYSSSGASKKSKSWGEGFISFSPGIRLAEPKDKELRAPEVTKMIKPKIIGKVFEAEFRSTKKGQEFLAIFRRSIDEPTHYLVVLKSKVRQVEVEGEPEKIKETTGKIISEAASISKSGSTQAYEAVVLLGKDDYILTNYGKYIVQNDQLVKVDEKTEV